MGTFIEPTADGVPGRRAAELTGVSWATAARALAPARVVQPEPRPAPANKLTATERAEVLQMLNSDEFVDKPPLQVYAILLERGQYVCSVSTMYRVLHENTQVRERCRQATHPPRKVPELVATAPGQVYSCYADVGIASATGSKACRSRSTPRGRWRRCRRASSI